VASETIAAQFSNWFSSAELRCRCCERLSRQIPLWTIASGNFAVPSVLDRTKHVRRDERKTKTRNDPVPQAKSTSNEADHGKKEGGFSRLFGDIANGTSQAAGRPLTFMVAAAVVLVWAVTGPIFQYSDTWQLVINTGTTIVTFLMVFLIQNSQNRDSAAIQVKLNELIRVSAAHNSFVGIEHLTFEELEDIRTKCEIRAKAEKAGEVSVKKTEKKARRAADRAVG
jgi:low affinity Fe/Cu permease